MKRVTAFGFWLGILCACIPLFMRGYGSYNQWQLRKAWDNRRAATHLAAARVTQEPTAADDLNWAQDSSATEAPSVATEDSSGDVNFSASKDAHAPETPAKAQDVSAPALHAARKVPGAAIAKTDGTNDEAAYTGEGSSSPAKSGAADSSASVRAIAAPDAASSHPVLSELPAAAIEEPAAEANGNSAAAAVIPASDLAEPPVAGPAATNESTAVRESHPQVVKPASTNERRPVKSHTVRNAVRHATRQHRAYSPVRLFIPKLGLDTIVLGSVSDTSLAKGPGHFPWTQMPGEEGDCAIAAHRNVWGSWFADLGALKPGDSVILETLHRRYVYKVSRSQVVSPNDDSVLAGRSGQRMLSLVTCTHPATRRLIVRARLDHASEE